MTVTLTVLGSADAFNSAGRGNAAFLVQSRRGTCCVDFGPTALAALKARRVDPNRIDAVFLTHLHGDHFGGLHLLFIDAQYLSRRERPLIIGGPIGTARRVEGWYRLAYGRSAAKRRFDVRYVEWAAGDEAIVGGWRVSTFRANHGDPRDGALSLRLSVDGVALAFSGDTGWSDELPRLARGADLLVCECTEATSGLASHLSWEFLEPRLGELRARRILLAHLGEGMRRRARAVRRQGLAFADDGMVVKIRKR